LISSDCHILYSHPYVTTGAVMIEINKILCIIYSSRGFLNRIQHILITMSCQTISFIVLWHHTNMTNIELGLKPLIRGIRVHITLRSHTQINISWDLTYINLIGCLLHTWHATYATTFSIFQWNIYPLTKCWIDDIWILLCPN